MTISILGCGWFGLPFGKKLLSQGHMVKGSTTSKDKVSLLQDAGIVPFVVDLPALNAYEIDPQFFDCDILVIAIPPKLRSKNAADYLKGITQAVDLISQREVKYVIFISSTSVFGDENKNVNENDRTLPETDSGKVLVAAEQIFIEQKSFKTTIVRFAGLIGPGRDPGRFFAGKSNIHNGRAPVNLIHLEDCCGVCNAVIQSMAFGHVIHACSPEHPSRQDFYTQASKRAGLEEPHFIDELTTWKIIETKKSDTLLSYQYSIGITRMLQKEFSND